ASELSSKSSGRFLYSRRAVTKVESSGSLATDAQISVAMARASTFHQKLWLTSRAIHWSVFIGGLSSPAPAQAAGTHRFGATAGCPRRIRRYAAPAARRQNAGAAGRSPRI